MIWEGLGLHLGGVVWGVSWALLGASWPFFGRSKTSFLKALVQDRLQEAIWIDLGGFWEGFGRIWEGLGPHFGGFWRLQDRAKRQHYPEKVFFRVGTFYFGNFWTRNGQILEMLAVIWPYCSRAYK